MPKPDPNNQKSPAAVQKPKKKERVDEGYGYRRNAGLHRPPDREKISEAGLKEEITRKLTTVDGKRRKNIIIWSYKDKRFISQNQTENLITTFTYDSEQFFLDSDEIRKYQGELVEYVEEFMDHKNKKIRPDLKGKRGQTSPLPPPPPPPKIEVKKESISGIKDEEDLDEGEKEAEEAKSSRPKKLLNLFNFSERGAQTMDNPLRERHCQTAPTPKSNFKNYHNQWMIYDAYEADEVNHVKPGKHELKIGEEGAEENPEEDVKKVEAVIKKEKKNDKQHEAEKVKIRKPSVIEGQAAVEIALQKAAEGLNKVERVVTQNIYEDILEDFAYFDDAADEYRDTGEGTLLPLWRFFFDRVKKIHVTGISWSASHPDLFAATFGSYNFVHPVQEGFVVLFSLRNASYPEQVWMMPKGAMAVDIHKGKNCLICVGLYDGNVAFLNMRKNEENVAKTIVLQNVPTELKHRAPVWTVKWGPDNAEGIPSFYSAGMDGRVIHWEIGSPKLSGEGGLIGTEIATLYFPKPPQPGPDGTTYKLFGCARVIAFHPKESDMFLVGTAEGQIFRCRTLYGSRFQEIYDAHYLPVAALEWNHFHPDIFLSASEDWTVKIWNQNDLKPMFVFEIGLPILDAGWAPFSSTVFACVTDEGKALVYDLNVNRDKPLCTQQVVTKKKFHPHRIAFNPKYPILMIGDDRGQLISLKLSPNLRVRPKDVQGPKDKEVKYLERDALEASEIEKMKRILSFVRDPDSLINPKSLPGPAGENYIALALLGQGPIRPEDLKKGGIIQNPYSERFSQYQYYDGKRPLVQMHSCAPEAKI